MGVDDPEVRFPRGLTEGPVPDYAPELGPCVLHIGGDNGNGYVQFRYDGKNGYAHRHAWERVNGSIPDGLTVDHLCRVRNCCNVNHMELVSREVNYIRACEAKDMCPNGHAYPYGSIVGERECEICKKATSKRSGDRRRRVANGLPDRRLKYDQSELVELVDRAIDEGWSTAELAGRIGCGAKYADKRIRLRRDARGLPRRRPRD